MLLEPRWDKDEFERLKTKTLNDLRRADANPNIIANSVFNKLIYGDKDIRGHRNSGTIESVSKIELQDLKDFYQKNFSPTISTFQIVGQIEKSEVMNELKTLESQWQPQNVRLPEYRAPKARNEAVLYFVDIPNAKQSVINIGYASLVRTDADYYPAQVMNYKLGGSFSGNVNLILREEKGYTYGARTAFNGSKYYGQFIASSSVRTNTTGESVAIFKDEISNYKDKITEDDLTFTKNA